MGCIILVMPQKENMKRIAEFIRRQGTDHDILFCSSGAAALREISSQDMGVIVCTTSLRDMNYLEFSSYLPATFGMAVLSKNIDIELVSNSMQCIPIPFKVGMLMDAIYAIFESLHRLDQKKTKGPSRRSEDEQQLINRAKLFLIHTREFSEPEAHRFIQKQAMNSGRSFIECAERILKKAR